MQVFALLRPRGFKDSDTQGFRHEWHEVNRNPNKGMGLGLQNGISEFEVYI
jgi:hypothetical protein